MKAKRSNYAGLIALFLLGAVGVSAIGWYISRTPQAQDVPAPMRRSSQGETPKPAAKDNPQSSSATVLTPKSKNGELSFSTSTEPVPTGTDPILFAVNRYIENAHIFKPQSRVLTKRMDPDGTLELDCTESMDSTFGSSDEQALIQGFAQTLAHFPEIKRVKFLVSGQAIETWGNVDISHGIDIANPGPTPADGSAMQNGA